ncbi:MAG: phosphoglycerate dehydrogenase [Clostridiaceae bacterium]|nr:phosphoglycerate dehydrogenase [Clostridiaceae bacterium]
MKVLFTKRFSEEKMNSFSELGYEIVYISEDKVSYSDDISEVDLLVCYNPFETLDISRLKKLKWIQLFSVGIDQLPKQKVIDKGIIVTNNRSGFSIPMGEWIIMKILELMKNSKGFYDKQREKKWQPDSTLLELYNKTVCFIGTGSIALEAAKRLQGFDVNITGINSTGRRAEYFNRCYPMKEMSYALSQADVVVVSIPYTKETHHLINDDSINSIKKGAYLINIARGSIIKETALIEALRNGNIHGAALDVFEEEPLSMESPLWEMNNVIITPHNSWISEMRTERRYIIVYENLRRYINGEALLNIVDIEKGY